MQVKDRIFYLIIAAMLIITAVGGSLTAILPADQAQAQYNTACYEEFGGARRVAASGCEYEFEAGSTLDVAGNADFTGATVTGISTSTLETLTVTGAITAGVDGTAGDVTFFSDTAGDYFLWDQSEEALVITGTNGQNALTVADGNANIDDDLDVNGTTNLDDVDIDLATSLNIDGHLTDIGSGTYATADGDNDLGVDGDAEVNGALRFGSDNLYPIGYASANQQVVCGTTAAFTGTLEVTPTGLTTVTYVIPAQITQPAATAVQITPSDPTTSTFTLYSWGADYNAGTTGVTAHYCAWGDQ